MIGSDIQIWCPTSDSVVAEEEHSADVSLSEIYYALKWGHFDGETENDGEDQRVKNTVSLLIPQGRRNISTTLAS